MKLITQLAINVVITGLATYWLANYVLWPQPPTGQAQLVAPAPPIENLTSLDPTPTPKLTPIQFDLPQGLRQGDAVRMEFTSRATVESPVMILKITVTDHLTGQPVPSTVSIGDFVSPNTTSLDIALPAHMKDFITFSAPGYVTQKIGLDYNIKSHKVFTMPVELIPVGTLS